MPSDFFNLQRFLEAQNPVYSAILRELRQGQKRTHWMWFIFPQLIGLGRSEIAIWYSLSRLEEARAYLAHPLLGARLRECTQIVSDVKGRSAHAIFGTPDDLKFHSSMTLFEQAAEADSIFTTAIDKYFDGNRDPATLALLGTPQNEK
jgi:uncharacterized protein (DUF1810 family)